MLIANIDDWNYDDFFREDGFVNDKTHAMIKRFCKKNKIGGRVGSLESVSYTHLTLPTILRV